MTITQKIKDVIGKLTLEKNIAHKVRIPECCIFCSSDEAQFYYNAIYKTSGRYVVSDISKIDKLVIQEDTPDEKISRTCPRCGVVTVKQEYIMHKDLVLYWCDPPCKKCNQKLLTPIPDKCPACEPGVAKAKAEMIKKVAG